MRKRSTIAFIVAVLLTAQSVQAQAGEAGDAMHQRIAALPANAHVTLQLTDGNAVRGRIASRAEQDFVLKPDSGGAPRTIAYAQVTTVEQVKERHSKTKWIVIGVVAGVLVVVAVIAVKAAHRPLTGLPSPL
jgi:hypothetical protein